MATTFNPSDKSSGITLSNGNLTVAKIDGWQAVRATLGRSTGKWYFEVVQVGARSDGQDMVGIANATASLDCLGQDGNGWVIETNGNKRHDNAGGSYASAMTAGDVYCIAVDLDAGKMWEGKNGTWNGDPGAGTDPAFSDTFGTVYPGVGGAHAEVGFTAHFIDTDLAYDAPSGFNPGWDLSLNSELEPAADASAVITTQATFPGVNQESADADFIVITNLFFTVDPIEEAADADASFYELVSRYGNCAQNAKADVEFEAEYLSSAFIFGDVPLPTLVANTGFNCDLNVSLPLPTLVARVGVTLDEEVSLPLPSLTASASSDYIASLNKVVVTPYCTGVASFPVGCRLNTNVQLPTLAAIAFSSEEGSLNSNIQLPKLRARASFGRDFDSYILRYNR